VLTRYRWPILIVTVGLAAGAGVTSAGVADRLSSGGFDDPASESVRAAEVLEERFATGPSNLVLVVDAPAGVDDAAVAAAGAALTERLAAEPGVADVGSYWSLGRPPPLRSVDGTAALVLGRITGDTDEVEERVAGLVEAYTETGDALGVRLGGEARVFEEIGAILEEDLLRSELIAFPVTLVLLLWVFRSGVAATLPLAVGGVAILGALVILRLLTEVTEVSVFALNLTTALGLGLGIDYSLFVVSRFREELAGESAVPTAVANTVATAGRTIAFSAATVAISLAALLVFPTPFLRSFAYAGLAVVALAGIAATVVLPAVLAVLGRRVDALSLPGRGSLEGADPRWRGIARWVTRFPLPVAAAVLAVLVALGTPFWRIELGLPDDRVLPAGSEVRAVQDEIRERFASNETGALAVVIEDTGGGDAVDALAADLSALPGVARVDAANGSFVGGARVVPASAYSARFAAAPAAWMSVVPSVEPLGAEGEALVEAIRSTPSELSFVVTGPGAALVDVKQSVAARIPVALGAIGVATLVLLFLMFGSVLMPIKAVVLNLASLSATFGAMVWVFQDGNLAEFLRFTPTESIVITIPVLMFCVAFGLSMDYEVFLLSRVKEEYDHSGDNQRSVIAGMERTGRIVTAAAALLAVVLIALAFSRVQFMRLMGVGLALAVIVDATLVRMGLVPAFMRLAGSANWWAPPVIRRFYRRLGLSEGNGRPETGEMSSLDLIASTLTPRVAGSGPRLEVECEPRLVAAAGFGPILETMVDEALEVADSTVKVIGRPQNGRYWVVVAFRSQQIVTRSKGRVIRLAEVAELAGGHLEVRSKGPFVLYALRLPDRRSVTPA
jgi:RND superfamily putative drug exporter